MAKTMTPSTEAKVTTTGQIDKAVANYRALLEKHASEFGVEAVQTVLGQPELAQEQLAVFRNRVEAQSNLLIRRATVDRTRTANAALKATGRNLYVDDDVAEGMPQGEGSEIELLFFTLGRDISDKDLDREYELRGLKPADPYSLAAFNEADPAFADQRPNGTHWKDSDGRWCCAYFNQWDVKRLVDVRRYDFGWDGRWWFAGVRK